MKSNKIDTHVQRKERPDKKLNNVRRKEKTVFS